MEDSADALALAQMKEELQLKDDLKTLTLTADKRQSDLAALQLALVNEKLAPDILPYESGVVQRVRKNCVAQTRPKELKRGAEDLHALREHLYELDEERVRYRLAEYWRVRLAKIQNYSIHVLSDPALLMRLSPFEQQFAKGYSDLLEKHLAENVANLLPPPCSSLLFELDEESPSIVPRPNLGVHVIAQILEPDFGVLSADDDASNYEVGSAVVVQYRRVMAALLEGKVCLI